MKYFKCVAKATIQGTEKIWKIKAEDDKEALFLFADTAMEHIEQFDNPELIQEETGCEYEYNYFVEEITEEEFNNLNIELL